MYPFTNCTGKMKVSEAMRLINWIAVDWDQKVRCIPEEQKMVGFGKSFIITSRILKTSARNN